MYLKPSYLRCLHGIPFSLNPGNMAANDMTTRAFLKQSLLTEAVIVHRAIQPGAVNLLHRCPIGSGEDLFIPHLFLRRLWVPIHM